MINSINLEHGGQADQLRQQYPEWQGEWLDLSTGINPWPYPVGEIAPEIWQRLPLDSDLRDLHESCRAAWGVPDDAGMVAAPGSQALIQWLPRLRPPGRVAVVSPTYGEHALLWRSLGHDVTEPTEPVLDADVLVIGQPNNPDGRSWPIDRLLDLADRQAARGGWLVVDEAFADADPALSLAPYARRAGLVILRSFGKFYGLAGVRLGILLGPPDLTRNLAAALGPWAVAGPTLVLATRAYRDTAWADATRIRLRQAAQDLDTILAAAGLRLLGGTPLFRLVASDDAPALYERLARHGIACRRFTAYPEWLRFGLPVEMGRLRDVLVR